MTPLFSSPGTAFCHDSVIASDLLTRKRLVEAELGEQQGEQQEQQEQQEQDPVDPVAVGSPWLPWGGPAWVALYVASQVALQVALQVASQVAWAAWQVAAFEAKVIAA